ncbi:MAG: hypothetical protein WCI72_01075 [archaeon]
MKGFNLSTGDRDEDHSDYLGKPGNYSNQWGGVVGVYIGTERDKHGVDYALFNPSIIYSVDNHAIVDRSKNSKLIMPLVVIRPLTCSLEEWAKRLNAVEARNSRRQK